MASLGIRVNAILPGPINTAQLDVTGDPGFEQVKEGTIPKRIDEPIKDACAVLFLATDKASYITGTDLLVDGRMKA